MEKWVRVRHNVSIFLHTDTTFFRINSTAISSITTPVCFTFLALYLLLNVYMQKGGEGTTYHSCR